jgi:hypothetical protein
MTNYIPHHLKTLANAREHIEKLERELAQIKAENAKVKPETTDNPATVKPKNEEPFYPIPFVSRATPESAKLYRERIAAAKEHVVQTKRDFAKARTLEEQNRAIELHKKAKQDLEAAYLDYSGMEWEKKK